MGKQVTIQPVTAVAGKPLYAMPKPTGPFVEWRHAPGDEPQYAVVTKVGKFAISVAIVPPDSRAMIPVDGVRHASDPLLKGQITDGGIWDFTEESKLLGRLRAIVESERNSDYDEPTL